MKNKFVSIIISIVILFLITVAVYKSYTPNSRIQKTAAISAETSAVSVSLTETASTTSAIEAESASTTTAAIEAASSSTEETTLETVEPTTEDISKNLPTLKIIVYEGPVTVRIVTWPITE